MNFSSKWDTILFYFWCSQNLNMIKMPMQTNDPIEINLPRSIELIGFAVGILDKIESSTLMNGSQLSRPMFVECDPIEQRIGINWILRGAFQARIKFVIESEISEIVFMISWSGMMQDFQCISNIETTVDYKVVSWWRVMIFLFETASLPIRCMQCIHWLFKLFVCLRSVQMLLCDAICSSHFKPLSK